MEEDQEQKHACKFCNKYFPCGRSLGGHMRSHMRTVKKDKLEKKKKKKSSSATCTNTCLVEFDAGGHVGYGLRENPKKTWRLSDSIQEKLCKECGKGFQSWKALFGHMRSHSDHRLDHGSFEEEEEEDDDEDSWIEASHKLIMDTQSETETAAPKPRKRSRTTRYKNTTTITANTTTTSSSSLSLVSEIEQEQEEVAMCLMMLSRDVGYWGGLNSLVESSDNNSVVAQVRSSVKENSNVKRRNKKLKCARFEHKRSQVDNSNLGVSRNGFKKLEVEASVDGSIELGKSLSSKNRVNRVKSSEVQLGKNLQTDSECDKYNSSKRIASEELSKKPKCITMDSPSKYECEACNKTFHSYQALGGHRASHKKTKGCFAAKTESSETSIEINATPDYNTDSKLIKSCITDNPTQGCVEAAPALKKNKHECLVCFKVFASGQALGGHKRSHVVESSCEARGVKAIAIQPQLPEIRDLLDLNLPAPVEEESNVGIDQFRPWWIGNNHKHEQAVGLIIN